jgi:hypothetical protein
MSIKELQDQAKLEKIYTTAFQNAKQVNPTPQAINTQGETSNKLLAINNLRTVTDPSIAQAIVDSLDENRINYLNKYFTTFKNSLLNQKILSLGDFQTRFNEFYIQDIGKSSQPTSNELIKKTIVFNRKYTTKELMNMSKRELDDLFRLVYKKNEGKEPAIGDTIKFIIPSKKEESAPREIIDTSDYVVLKTTKTPFDSENPKMRYIYRSLGDRTFALLTPNENKNFKWQGIDTGEGVLRTTGEGLGSGIEFPKSKTLKKKSAFST